MNKLENDILLKRLHSLSDELEERKIFSERNVSADKKLSYAFVVYALERFLDNYALDEIMPFVTEGPGDHDIDIFHIDEDDNTAKINLFQVKFKQENNLGGTIGEKEVASFLDKVKRLIIDADPNIAPPNNFLAQKHKEFVELTKPENEIEKITVNLYLVTNASDINDQEKMALERFKKENGVVGECKCLCNYSYFFDSEDNDIGEIQIPITGNAIDMSEEIPAKVVNIPAYQIAKLYEKFKDRILEKNVRKLLKGKTNKEIEESLINNAKFFWYKNNGLSIVCRRMEIKTLAGIKTLILENPYVVNGGQTTKTIFNLFSRRNESNEDQMKPFYEASVMARIYQTTDENIINDIVYGTNNQNKITVSDLKSLNPNIRKIKQFFAENDISLLTKRDSEVKISGRSISSDLLLQIYWAIYGDTPHKSKRSKTKLLEEKFDDIFSSISEHKNLLASYKTYNYVSSKIKSLDAEIAKHGLYSLLFTMAQISPAIKNEYDEQVAKDAYKKAAEVLRGVIEEQKSKDSAFSAHNFFKSQKSTSEILNALELYRNTPELRFAV